MTIPCELLLGGGLGAAPSGSVPFGSEMPDGIVLLSATVEAENEVCLTFAGNLNANPCLSGSPLNPLAWELSVLDPPKKKGSFVQFVEVSDDGKLCLYFDRPLCCGFAYQLRLTNQDPALDACTTVEFVGLCVADSARPSDNRTDDGYLRDIANPFLERDVSQTDYPALGTYEVTPTGDIAQDSGQRSLRKRMIRRAVTLLGEFFHLPGYGSDLETKKLLKPDLLRRYQEKLRVQLKREPEIRSAVVSISQVVGASNVVSIRMTAYTAGPTSISATVNIPV